MVILRTRGDLTSTNAGAVRAAIGETLAGLDSAGASWHAVQLDLAAAKMVDSVGLNLVVGLLKQVQQRGARLQVTGANSNIVRAFTFTRLDRQVDLVKA